MRILNANKANNDINITVNTKAPELAAIIFYGRGRELLTGYITLKPSKASRKTATLLIGLELVTLKIRKPSGFSH
jgi:hypothetical protein